MKVTAIVITVLIAAGVAAAMVHANNKGYFPGPARDARKAVELAAKKLAGE